MATRFGRNSGRGGRKPPKPARGHSWVDPGNPFGVGTPKGPPALPPNAGEVVTAALPKPAAPPPAAPPPAQAPSWTAPDYRDGAPDDAASTLAKSAAENAYNQLLSSVAAQRVAAGEEFGYDPNTGGESANVDVTNPYSRAALMNRSFRQKDRMTTGSFGMGGRLSSGAFAAALESNRFDQGGQRKALQREFAQKLLDYRSQEQGAEQTKAVTLAQIQADLINRRMQQDAANAEAARWKWEQDQAAIAAAAGGGGGGEAAPAPAAPSKPTYIGNMLGELNLPASYGQMVGNIIANPPKPKPAPKPKPKPKPKGKK